MDISDYLTGSKEDHGWLFLLLNWEHNRDSSQIGDNVAKSQNRPCNVLCVIHNSGFLQQRKGGYVCEK